LSDIEELQQLCARYARAVDRRDSHAFLDLFEPGATLRVYEGSEHGTPIREVDVSEEMAAGMMAMLSTFAATAHFIGTTTFDVAGDVATGESYTVGHHLSDDEQGRRVQSAHVRYLDSFRKTDSGWRFVERNCVVDWSETRQVEPPGQLEGVRRVPND
jgi:hypothetical protein